MSSADEEDVMLKLDACVDVETTVKHAVEDEETTINPETFASKCVVSTPEDESELTDNKTDHSNRTPTELKGCTNIFSGRPVFKVPGEPRRILSDSKNVHLSKRTSIYDKFVHPCVPKINCSEKIIFCLDMSSEMDQIPFKFGDGSQHSPLSMVKRTIELFVENKNFISRKHEYSIMVLYDTATWVREFTNDPKDLIDSLADLNEVQMCTACDLSSVVSLLTEKYEMTIPSKLSLLRHVFRVILIYGRSNCMIHFSNEEAQDILMKYPFLFLDIIYIHEPPTDENRCEEIFENLCDLDEQNKSYIFEVTRNTTKLHNCMAKLLAHPLQRCAQKDSFYRMRPFQAQELD